MDDRKLSTWQIASLLASTSCGIGFLLGTGELALRQGMAACLYAVATAIGLLTLAIAAPRLWKTGQSIWGYFDTTYGPAIGRQVAALSLIWMTGVLGAQIRGASALLELSGVSRTTSIVAVDCLVFGLSFVRLSSLSSLFAICLGGCNAILVYALIREHHLTVWLHAPENFAQSVHLRPIGHVSLTLLSVVALVICGADYQQFLLRARTPSDARSGCLLAAAVVFVIGFLPASTVIANRGLWQLNVLPDPAQAVPIELAHTLGHTSGITLLAVAFVLLIAALGAACSILLAMSDATSTLWPGACRRAAVERLLPVLAATLVATSGQSIIDMMVMLNIIYLAAVGPLLGLTLLNCHITYHAAKRSMLTGFGIAMTCYLVRWTNTVTLHESLTLVLAWPCALLEVLRHGLQRSEPAHPGSSQPLDSKPVTHLRQHRQFPAEEDRGAELAYGARDGSQDR
ncbi:hypothetical protein GXB81_15075 [Paraburkholderia sp. Ac-20336]|uniref:hypothetical protein n=1 Tax=Paraburkholderia sp. Ac-20336 TaxID=2703886 RepID=UPI00197DDF77|nr:hypothetical protein [Paraburkholderia sp. Ac-20336]MBN3804363.1 hypothetical protein [Paraburkholderia sp. Ac-20336]